MSAARLPAGGPASRRFPGLSRLRLICAVLLAGLLPLAAWPAPPEGDITLSAHYWIDPTGRATVAEAAARKADWQPMTRHRPFTLRDGALWLRLELPARDPAHRWFLQLSGAAFIDEARLFTRSADGGWREQRAGDHVPVAGWPHPNSTPLFDLPPGAAAATAWLRLANQPAPASPFVQLLTESSVRQQQQWTALLVGAYLGFGVLVFVVGLIHARLYGDRVFLAYCLYVACMLLFQLAYTGLGGLFLWPGSARFNDAAPALFLFLMVGSGLWFNREATALRRHGRRADRAVMAFVALAPLLAVVYPFVRDSWGYPVLNVYGLLSVGVSIAMCAWTWRRGEAYSGWLLLGFLPIHLAYPFPALRAAGVLPDSWATQYAVLIGSAIEIPLLLYILHRRAKDFSENHARLRAMDSTDPLTGLAAVPVLRLRTRDALRRARRSGQSCALLLVELANHAEIVAREGREAGDRALVLAGARLSQVVREVDTVCRVADTRFALLVDDPQADDLRQRLAQHVVARGLERVPRLPPELPLRFKVVTAAAPGAAAQGDAAADEQRLMARLHAALDELAADSRRVIVHLPSAAQAAQAPAAAGAERLEPRAK